MASQLTRIFLEWLNQLIIVVFHFIFCISCERRGGSSLFIGQIELDWNFYFTVYKFMKFFPTVIKRR